MILSLFDFFFQVPILGLLDILLSFLLKLGVIMFLPISNPGISIEMDSCRLSLITDHLVLANNLFNGEFPVGFTDPLILGEFVVVCLLIVDVLHKAVACITIDKHVLVLNGFGSLHRYLLEFVGVELGEELGVIAIHELIVGAGHDVTAEHARAFAF